MDSSYSVTQQSFAPLSESTKRSWRFWAIILSLSVTSLLSALDVSVISTAMPSIVEDLGSSAGYIWIANAYFLTMTGFQPLYGQTANIYGRRSLTLLAIFLFVAGSGISGAANNLEALIAGRAIQGIGGGGINILIEIIIADLVPLRERTNFTSIVFIAYTIAIVLGPVIGGLMTERVTWRWIFYLNLPISVHNSLKRVDFIGNGILLAAVVSILLALTWGGVDYAWSSWRTLLPLILGLFGLAAFVAFEFSSNLMEPTMAWRIFSNRTSAGAFALTFIHAALSYTTTYFLPVYFQGVLETGPTTSGVNLLPLAAVTMPFAIIAALGVSRFGYFTPWFYISTVLFAVGFGTFTLLDKDSSKAMWAGLQCIVAAALGMLTTTPLPAIQAPLDEADQAIITATWGFVRSFGGVWGVAIPAAAFNSRVNSLLHDLAGPEKEVQQARAMLSDGGAYAMASMGGSAISRDWSPELKAQIKHIYVQSLQRCWQVALGFSLLGFLICFTIKEVRLRTELDTKFGLKDDKKNITSKEVPQNNPEANCPDTQEMSVS